MINALGKSKEGLLLFWDFKAPDTFCHFSNFSHVVITSSQVLIAAFSPTIIPSITPLLHASPSVIMPTLHGLKLALFSLVVKISIISSCLPL